MNTTAAPGPATLPDYRGGGIVNLMVTIAAAFGAEERIYPPLRALPPARLASRNVVLLVVDGLGYDCLQSHCPDGFLAGQLVARLTSVFPSTTATAVTTFLTGTAPQQHGVTGWFMYVRELRSVLTVLPYRHRDGRAAALPAAAELLDPAPLFDRLDARSHVVAPQRIVNSSFNTAFKGAACLRGFETLEQMFATSVAAVCEPGRRNYVYAYWSELDRIAHEHGIRSSAVAGHLGELDAGIARFAATLRGTDTTLIVTADHGFIDARPEQRIELAMHPELARMLALPLCGEPRAAYLYLQADRRSEVQRYVSTHFDGLAALVDSERLIESGHFGLGAAHPALRERIGDCALIMRQGAVLKDWLPGEPRYAHVGVHGGLSAEEMYVPLSVVPP
jgi:hypothetical protein